LGDLLLNQHIVIWETKAQPIMCWEIGCSTNILSFRRLVLDQLCVVRLVAQPTYHHLGD